MIRLGRYPERGRYDFATIASILDESIFCHVGLADSRGPIVLPTLHGRIDRALYIHGSVLAHWLKGASERDVCVSVTIADGIVLARSAFAHSMNFRSVVVLGRAVTVADAGEKLQALRAISEHACAGRWDDVRPPSERELQATLVMRISIETASAKVRNGPPIDAPGDMDLRVWAGELPLRIERGRALTDPRLDIPIPAYVLPPFIERTPASQNNADRYVTDRAPR
jgi:nitroimidazol reductase NimA-like FMN-containing flavoprotein (pyridoxamine 5'-phosphate oxidase superfamily)